MKGDYGAVYPLWSHDDRPGGLLDRLAGEVGVTHLTIPVITGPVTQFRPRPANGPHLFHTEGGWHYPPAAAGYTASAVRPRSAAWFGKRNVLRSVCDLARERGLRVDARVDLRAVAGLYEHEPHLRMRNAWGEEIPGALCVNNADLRALCEEVVGELAELAGYGVGGVQLVDWLRGPPADAVTEGSWPDVASALLQECFCPSCRGLAVRAEVDVEVATRVAREVFDQLWASDPHGEDEPPPLRQMRAAREQDLRAWLERLPARFGDVQWVLKSRDFDVFESDTLPAGFRPVAPVFEYEPFAASGVQLGTHARRLKCALGGVLMLTEFEAPGDGLVRLVHEARQAGVQYFDFEQIEQAAPDAMEWLAQALRFARRDDSPA